MTSRIAITYHPPGSLKPNPWNPNQMGPEMEKRLQKSLADLDFFKPIIVRELASGDLQILGGEHRAHAAGRSGVAEVPVVNLGRISDSKAKAIGQVDNGRYGEDDALMLSAVLKDLKHDGYDVTAFLPISTEDLAGIFASDEIDLDALGDLEKEDDKDIPDPTSARPTITHTIMRFKVPVEDQEKVQALFDHVIKSKGLKDQDSMVMAGMALVLIANAAREVI